jgi:hypothetical protein
LLLLLLLTEFERDLELHVPGVWLDMRADRGDGLLLSADRPSLAPAALWRPVLRALLAAVRKQAGEVKRLQETTDTLSHQAALAESKVWVRVCVCVWGGGGDGERVALSCGVLLYVYTTCDVL